MGRGLFCRQAQGDITLLLTNMKITRSSRDGRNKHPLYSTWLSMFDRCYSPKAENYKYYGARGIEVCLRWTVDFWAFVDDMGPKPAPNYSIDRIDPDGDYSPHNCSWASPTHQSRNRRWCLNLLTDEEKRNVAKAQRRISSLKRDYGDNWRDAGEWLALNPGCSYHKHLKTAATA